MTDQAHPATTSLPVDLDQIERVLAEATPEPWEASPVSAGAIINPDDPGSDTEATYYGGKVIGESISPVDEVLILISRAVLPRLVAELRAAHVDRDYFEGRLDLANEVIDAYREYAPGSMPMVDARLRHYDATAEGGS